MFNYTQFTNDLIKAMTHKYVRRIPKGVTKTGATKYMYYYAGQEGHGKGLHMKAKSFKALLLHLVNMERQDIMHTLAK